VTSSSVCSVLDSTSSEGLTEEHCWLVQISNGGIKNIKNLSITSQKE
jgi:hypothetical protein